MASEEPSSSGTLPTFLRKTRESYLEAVKSGTSRDWTVVMGNEAGDLDSIASAVAYAWYATKVKRTVAVPLTQTPRGDLHLRAENLHAFELAGLHPDTDILCIDDVPQPESSPFPSVNFALVDHNRLHSRFSRDNPDARVVAVVDHHEDEGLYKDTADPRIIVVPTGSCASLVTLLFQDHAEYMVPELATLLLSSIVIDTGGLKPGGKAEDADRRAASFLVPLALASQPHAQSSQLLVEAAAPEQVPFIRKLNLTLQEKKASVAHLSSLDLLRRDYKEYALTPAHSPSREILIGLSSVPIGFHSWLPHHPDFWAATEQFMTERGLTVLGILTSFRAEKLGKNGKQKHPHRREQMYVVCDDETLAQTLFNALDQCAELELEKRTFVDFGVSPGFGMECYAQVWSQHNVTASRKAIAPLIKGIIEGRVIGPSL